MTPLSEASRAAIHDFERALEDAVADTIALYNELVATVEMLARQRDAFAGLAWHQAQGDRRMMAVVTAMLEQQELQLRPVAGHA